MRPAVVLALLALSSPAFAQPHPSSTPTPAAASSGGQAAGRPTPRTATPFQQAIVRGMEAYRRHEYDASITAFREAAGLDAQSAVPQLYLGYLYATRGDAATALGSLREASRLALVAGDDANRGRAMEAIAGVLEALGHWDEARQAWQDYVTFGDGHASVAFPAVGRARIEAIGRRATLATEYAPVRQRIADRVRINAQGQQQGGQQQGGQPGAAPSTGSTR